MSPLVSGTDDPDPSTAVRAVPVSTGRLWSGERGLRYDGEHYRLDGVHSGPVPVHDMGIWLGAYGPRMLEVTGRVADGWISSSSYAPPDELPDMQRRIDDAAEAAGRDPDDILRSYNVNGRIITDRATEGRFIGDQDHWLDVLSELHHEVGVEAFIIWSDGDDHDRQSRAFAEIADELRPSG